MRGVAAVLVMFWHFATFMPILAGADSSQWTSSSSSLVSLFRGPMERGLLLDLGFGASCANV